MATYNALQGCVTLQEAGGLYHCGEWMSTFWSTDCDTGQFEEPDTAVDTPGPFWKAADKAAYLLYGILGAHQ